MYGTLNYIAEDMHMLYNPVVDFVMCEMKCIRWDGVIRNMGSGKDRRSLEKFVNCYSNNNSNSVSSSNSNSNSNVKYSNSTTI